MFAEVDRTMQEIEEMRNKLHELVKDKGVSSREALHMSRELDLVILRYFKDEKVD